jgi:hypothetical protein
MARKKSPSSKALAALPDAAGGSLALQANMLAKAGYDEKAQAQIAREVIERTRARATGAMRQQPVVVGDGKGLSHVEMVEMPDEPLRQRADEHLTDVLGLQPSRSTQVAVQNTLTVVITKREPPTFVDAKVIEVKP